MRPCIDARKLNIGYSGIFKYVDYKNPDIFRDGGILCEIYDNWMSNLLCNDLLSILWLIQKVTCSLHRLVELIFLHFFLNFFNNFAPTEMRESLVSPGNVDKQPNQIIVFV